MTCEKCNGNCQDEDCTDQCNDCSNECNSCSASVATGWSDHKMEKLVTSTALHPHIFINPYESVTLDTTKIKTLEDMLLLFQVMLLQGGESVKVNVRKQQLEAIKHLIKE